VIDWQTDKDKCHDKNSLIKEKTTTTTTTQMSTKILPNGLSLFFWYKGYNSCNKISATGQLPKVVEFAIALVGIREVTLTIPAENS
jgi:hypothetical protein